MTSQLALFPTRPTVSKPQTLARSRATDPSSSQDAARAMNESGAAASHAEIVLAALKAHPKSTYRELSSYLPGLEPAETQRRLDGLRRAGLATTTTNVRFCTVTNRGSQEWVAL